MKNWIFKAGIVESTIGCAAGGAVIANYINNNIVSIILGALIGGAIGFFTRIEIPKK